MKFHIFRIYRSFIGTIITKDGRHIDTKRCPTRAAVRREFASLCSILPDPQTIYTR